MSRSLLLRLSSLTSSTYITVRALLAIFNIARVINSMLRTVKFPFTVRTHATLATMTKLEWLVHRILSFTIHTHATLATMTKLEWLVHRVLSFTVRTRDARNDDIHYRPMWGSLRLAPIIRKSSRSYVY